MLARKETYKKFVDELKKDDFIRQYFGESIVNSYTSYYYSKKTKTHHYFLANNFLLNKEFIVSFDKLFGNERPNIVGALKQSFNNMKKQSFIKACEEEFNFATRMATIKRSKSYSDEADLFYKMRMEAEDLFFNPKAVAKADQRGYYRQFMFDLVATTKENHIFLSVSDFDEQKSIIGLGISFMEKRGVTSSSSLRNLFCELQAFDNPRMLATQLFAKTENPKYEIEEYEIEESTRPQH